MAKAPKKTTPAKIELSVEPPKMAILHATIYGTPESPYVQHKFSQKARNQMMEAQQRGGTKAKNKNRDPKDFDEVYRNAMHIAEPNGDDPGGWYGIPAAAIRSSLISACRISGFTMTHAKISVFVLADGRDADDSSPLVKITKGEPIPIDSHVRNETGVADVRRRPAFMNWEAELRIQYDANIFKPEEIVSLLIRAGTQVGVGEGRHDSKKSNGQGWGCYYIKEGSVSVEILNIASNIRKLFADSSQIESANLKDAA